jgi:multiple antibiotic resistance protein
MFSITSFLKDTLSLLAIVEPLGAIPVFLTLTAAYSQNKQLRVARRAAMSGFLILLSALVAGKLLLEIFGISLSSLRVAGGIMFLVMGIQLVISEPVKITNSEISEAENLSDVAVVPLALPILSGPGAMGAVILLGDKGNPLIQMPKVGLIIGIVMFLSYLCFRLANPIGKKLGITGLNILNRISGLIVLAIGVEFILAGVNQIWKSFL